MIEETPGELTKILNAANLGDSDAVKRLWESVYQELYQMARSQMARESPGRTLHATALVHEAYLRLLGGDGSFENRKHFFAAASRAMHQIIVDDARRRSRLKRGGNEKPVSLQAGATEPAIWDKDPAMILAIDEALMKLKAVRPELVELVGLRYFVGLSVDETAEVLGVARRTVVNQWQVARATLFGMLSDGEEHPID